MIRAKKQKRLQQKQKKFQTQAFQFGIWKLKF
jgi:hypothetical protein